MSGGKFDSEKRPLPFPVVTTPVVESHCLVTLLSRTQLVWPDEFARTIRTSVIPNWARHIVNTTINGNYKCYLIHDFDKYISLFH